MLEHFAAIATRIFRIQTDRFLTVAICLLALLIIFGDSRRIVSRRGKFWRWLGGLGVLIVFGVSLGVYFGRSPHGLAGSYYDNAVWSGEPVNSERYFETPGRRFDRFLDFNQNDFTDRYPFSGKPFSVKWQGYLDVPAAGYQVGVKSNFETWLYLDEELVAGPHQLDFGTPEARSYLREGWSQDERWGKDAKLSFIWSSGPHSEFDLGVDELTDYRLVMRCLPFTYPGSPAQEITIQVNGVPLNAPVRLKEGWQTYAIPVSRAVLQGSAPGFFRVGLTYDHVVRPADVSKQMQDARQLAVAFDFVTLQKLTAASQETAFVSQKPLSPGLHRITLKAQSDGVNPCIQLVWNRTTQQKAEVIPEDALFPADAFSATGSRGLGRERIILGLAIIAKGCFICLLGGVILIYRLPFYFRKLWRRDLLFILGFGLFALGVRLAFLLELKRLDPTFYVFLPGTDQLNYVFFARGFWRGYWPSLSHEPFFQAPLISFYFIVCSLLFGEHLTAIRLMTVMLSVGTVCFTYLIANRVFPKPVASIAAGLCAANGVLIFYDTSVLIEPVLIFLSLAALWLMDQCQAGFAWRTAGLLGITLGLTALARSNIFLLLPFLFFWMVLTFPGSIWRKIAHYLVICLVMLLTILPVTLRNYFSWYKHPLVLTNSNGGITFWIGNNASSNGSYYASAEVFNETRNHMNATGNSFADEVFRYIRANPLAYLKLEAIKLKLFWRGYEIGNLLPYYPFRDNSKILSLPWVNFVLLGPLALVGMFLALKSWKRLLLLYSYVVVQMLTTLLFFAIDRYRLPVVPVLSIFAAYALWEAIQAFQQKRWLNGGLLVGMALILYLALNYPDAAHLYQQHHGEPMPLSRIFRYWDVFQTP